MTMSAAPFARAASHALLGDDLVVGDQVDRVVELLGPDGTPIRELSWPGPPLSLRDDEVVQWREDQVASAPAADRAAVRLRLTEMPLPDRRPAHGRLLTDDVGFVWVGAYAHPSKEARRWDVLEGSSGRWPATAWTRSASRFVRSGGDRPRSAELLMRPGEPGGRGRVPNPDL